MDDILSVIIMALGFYFLALTAPNFIMHLITLVAGLAMSIIAFILLVKRIRNRK